MFFFFFFFFPTSDLLYDPPQHFFQDRFQPRGLWDISITYYGVVPPPF